MKFIESSAELIEIEDPIMKIEKIGRTCYKSDSDFTQESAEKFYRGLASRHHYAMLEHAYFVFQVNREFYDYLQAKMTRNKTIQRYFKFTYDSYKDPSSGLFFNRYLVSANLRALNESKEEYLLSYMYKINPLYVYSVDPNYLFKSIPNLFSICLVKDVSELPYLPWSAYSVHKSFTFLVTCDRGVSHEIVRHRPCSFAQESTRYCNYLKAKFNGELTYIYPAGFDKWDKDSRDCLIDVCEVNEKAYEYLIRRGKTPQQARAVLPNCLKTEIIITANVEEFEHFFALRSAGVTGAPHPDMKIVADKMLYLYENANGKDVSKRRPVF